MDSMESTRQYSDSQNERPRTIDTSWLALGRVVYGWTDRRDASVDRAWWRTQKARFSVGEERPTTHNPEQAASDSHDPVKADIPTEAGVEAVFASDNWIFRSNLRVVG